MARQPRGIFDYAPKAAARNRSLLPAEDDAPGFFSASLEDVYRQKYGGRYPHLSENVASAAATGLKAIGVPKHVAETTGRNIAQLGEDWTGFSTLTAAEHLPEGNVKDIGLTEKEFKTPFTHVSKTPKSQKPLSPNKVQTYATMQAAAAHGATIDQLATRHNVSEEHVKAPQYLAKILETKPPIVKMNQKTLDRVMAHLRSQDPSKWAVPLAAGAGGSTLLADSGEAQAGPAPAAPRSPVGALHERVMDEAYATRSSPRDVLKRMLGLP